ncbi:hypothetical protein [Saccharothrix hoggarensis]|uniref:Uncharacterized protein n=1 Tax=Saccharothrix hoggarensis TaxID=913853 RepID=A0ABW3QZY7_9PSEU
MNALLSGDTATAAVPAGQPDPLTVTTSMVMWSGGGVLFGAPPGGMTIAAAMLAATTKLNMEHLPTRPRTEIGGELRRSGAGRPSPVSG